MHRVGDLAAAQDVGDDAQVLDAAVGARADEDGVDGDVAQRRAGVQAHVGQARARRLRAADGSSKLCRIGDRRRQRRALAGVGAPGDARASVGGVDGDDLVEDGVVVGDQRAPVRDRGVPVGAVGACGRPSRYSNVVSSGATMPARAPASIDMLQIVMRPSIDSAADGLAAVLDDVTLTTAGADAAR